MLVSQIYGRICRICLENASKLINLNETIPEYSLTMLELLHLSVPRLENDINFPVPQAICESCRNQLLTAYKLQLNCMATNKKLYRIWQESINKESTAEHTEDGKRNEAQHIKQSEIEVDCDELNSIHIEFKANEKHLENKSNDTSKQLSNNSPEKQHGSTTNELLQYNKEVKNNKEVEEFDDDDNDDDDDKPLICLRKKFSKTKHEIKAKETFGCAKCRKKFSSTTLMQKHILRSHGHKVLRSLTTEFTKLKSPKEIQLLSESSQDDKSLQGQFEDCLVDSQFDDVDSDCVILEDFENGDKSRNISMKTDPTPPSVNSLGILNKYGCSECTASFRFPKQLERHRKKHTDAHRFVCLICSDRFKYPFMLQKHVEKHHPALSDQPKVDETKKETQEKTQVCNYCSAAYTNVGGLAQHISKKHPDIVPFKCDKCDKTFVVEEHLKVHTNRHMGIKNFKCDLCDKSFSYKFAMKQHMRIHTGDLNYLCTLCGKKFYRPSNLRQHMQRHGDEKPYTCPHCPKRFKCPSDRYIHLMSHQEGKNHVCATCGSRFTRLDTLHQHQILHSGEKPYKCDQCPMAFPRMMNLNRHLRTHTGEKPYKCKYCDKAYAQSNDLNKHLRTHVGENTYMCTQCPSAFKYQAELKVHEWEHYRKQKEDEKQE